MFDIDYYRRQGRAQGSHDAHQAKGPQEVFHPRARSLQPGGGREGRQDDRSQVRLHRSVERQFCSANSLVIYVVGCTR